MATIKIIVKCPYCKSENVSKHEYARHNVKNFSENPALMRDVEDDN
jgi:transposase-like protein